MAICGRASAYAMHHGDLQEHIITSWYMNTSRISGPLWGESIVALLVDFPSHRTSYVELWWFSCCSPEQAVEKNNQIVDAMTLMWRRLLKWHQQKCDRHGWRRLSDHKFDASFAVPWGLVVIGRAFPSRGCIDPNWFLHFKWNKTADVIYLRPLACVVLHNR